MRRSFLFWALISMATLFGCVTVTLFERERDVSELEPTPEPTKPRRFFDHRVHVQEAELACAECHLAREALEDDDFDGDDRVWREREPMLPDAESCFECHDPNESEDGEITAFFGTLARAGAGRPWHRLLDFIELKFPHIPHSGSGKADCLGCHSGVLDNDYLPKGIVEFKQACFECHESWEGEEGCASCHRDYRSDRPPADHGSPEFLRFHGKGLARPGAESSFLAAHGEFGADACTFCHTETNCSDCHRSTRPQSHHPRFSETHGQLLLRTGDQSSCLLCHEPNSCQDCHGRERPRSHTQAFARFDHGLSSSLDRSRCATCHTQNFCQSCHEVVQPRSHRGAFAGTRQSHCVSCHEPVSRTSCSTCHKSTQVHLALATPMQDTPPHRTGTECKSCHRRISHMDNGDGAACRVCHRIR